VVYLHCLFLHERKLFPLLVPLLLWIDTHIWRSCQN